MRQCTPVSTAAVGCGRQRCETRRDALLLLATFGTAADSPLLRNYSEFDDDPLNREIANLGVERLKDIPLWERA